MLNGGFCNGLGGFIELDLSKAPLSAKGGSTTVPLAAPGITVEVGDHTPR
jgi:hypothetical protein